MLQTAWGSERAPGCRYLIPMPTVEAVMQSLEAQYSDPPPSDVYVRLYEETPTLNLVFASLHERLNGLFLFMNTKIDRGRHYNADQSRDLLSLINEIRDVRGHLGRVDIELVLREDYQHILDEGLSFLVPSGGSAIPDDFKKINIERFEPVFSTGTWAAPASASKDPRKTVMVGEGAFAFVYTYDDPEYGFNVAAKVAKKNLGQRELDRFRKEYDLLSSLSFPYIVQAYKYDDARDAFTMEFCDSTLGDYIKENNSSLAWTTRKRIALQFLYGLNYLHVKKIFHRDISRRNILIKKYDLGAVVVKLSDFGLHKDEGSDYTKVDTSLKGTILDPTLESFKQFSAVNDIYAVGHILSFIFSGKAALGSCTGRVQEIIEKCTDNTPGRRYQSVAEVIEDVEAMTPPEAVRPNVAPA